MRRAQSRINDYKSVIFLHIPKAAGSTLWVVMSRQYSKTAFFDIDGANVESSIEEFKSLPESQRNKLRCLRGHMRFGLHAYLPQPCAYITLLRHPVDRIISHYYYVLRTSHHYLYEQVTSQNMTLEDYVRSQISSELTNGQTRMLAGIPKDQDENPPPDMLAVARKNLIEHFLVVGLAERFDESLILMKRRLGWGNVCYTRLNVTLDRPAKFTIPEATLRLVRQINEQDLELYNFAKRIFVEDVRREGLSFHLEVIMFRLLNKVYGVLRKESTRKLIRSLVHRIKTG